MVELSGGASVALGVIVGLISTSIQSLGLTLQRKSHMLEDEKGEGHQARPPYRRRRWQVGMLMFLIANIVGSTIQITTLPLPVLSTLQASGLVFNTLCASLLLAEPFTRYSAIGTLLVAGGAVLIGFFGALTEPSHNLTQLLVLLQRRDFLLWLFGSLFLVALILLSAWFFKRLYPRQTPRSRLLRGMAFGSTSGILSAHTLLVAKSAVELLVRTIVDRHNQFDKWQAWMILLGLIVLALAQLYLLHRGLKLASTSVLYPFVFCIYNIFAILDGLIYFRQTSRLPVLHACLIAVGTVVLLMGVLALSWRLSDEHHHSHTPGSPEHARSRARTMSAVGPPRTVLTPGLGIVNPKMDEDSISCTSCGSYDDREDADVNETDPLFPHSSGAVVAPLEDEEAAVGKLSVPRRNRRREHSATGKDENGPLLEPAPRGNMKRNRRTISGTGNTVEPLQISKLRQSSGQSNGVWGGSNTEIWNALNDREGSTDDANEGYRRSSYGSIGPRRSLASSGSAGKTGQKKPPARSKTLPLGVGVRQRWWNPKLGGAKAQENDDPESDDEVEDEGQSGDQATAPGEENINGRGPIEGEVEQEGREGWFKLKWWKRRTRD
ncbi:hypothetical protein K402DRAFT_14910 [Aulographum hederae CBS 113979]|uniref:DUF803-domain-containing protein n=1 Tax=Aulographum hederae CBS 113979 TaxID=1176131 RepID=A0A6G1H7U5_9PEZI|nr:hypothetical protein K402DRAFT_14910 [Aulographum hederae CBS 113979]